MAPTRSEPRSSSSEPLRRFRPERDRGTDMTEPTALDALFAKLQKELLAKPRPVLPRDAAVRELLRLADGAKDPRRIDQARALCPSLAAEIWPT